MLTTNKNYWIKLTLGIVVSLISIAVYYLSPVYGIYLVSFAISLVVYLFFNKRNVKYVLVYLGVFIACWLSLIDYTGIRQAKLVRNRIIAYQDKYGKTPKTVEELFEMKILAMTPTFGDFKYSNQFDSTIMDNYRIEYKDFWGNNIWYCPMDDEWEVRNRP